MQQREALRPQWNRFLAGAGTAGRPGLRGWRDARDAIYSGFTTLQSPVGWSWQCVVGVLFAIAAVGDLITTTAMLTWHPATYHEANVLARWGQAHFGLVPYCIIASIGLLFLVLPLAVSKPKTFSGWVLHGTALVVLLMKVIVVAHNAAIWANPPRLW